MWYETGLFEKTKCLVKTIKKVFFGKVASTYKSSGSSDKLPKMTKCVYIIIIIIIIIITSC